MTTHPRKLTLAALAAAFALTGSIAWAGEKIDFRDAPEAVRQTVDREIDRSVNRLEIKSLDGQTAYEAEYEIDDVDRAIWIGEDGTLLARAVEIRRSELPQAVREAVLARYPGADIEDVDRLTLVPASGDATQTPDVRYDVEIEIKQNGREIERDLMITANGTILSDELDD